MTPMQDLDLTGLKCPLPVLQAQKALAHLPKGARLSIRATDPMAVIDIPHFCAQKGHILHESDTDEGGILSFVIEKG